MIVVMYREKKEMKSGIKYEKVKEIMKKVW
jgi:hypothetical protein